MSELSEEEIARAMCDGNWDARNFNETPNGESPEDQREYWRGKARAVLALLQPALERAREALTDEQDHLLMCAIENLRSAERNDRTVEAAWRMAEKMEAWRKAAAIRKG